VPSRMTFLLMIATLASITAIVNCCFAQSVDVWLTTDNQRTKLAKQTAISFTSSNTGLPAIYVDET
jgi:hypothetical protein